MKKILISMIVMVFIFGQDLSNVGKKDEKNNLEGGLGLATINGKTYYSFTFTPEVKFGKIGVGLNLELFYNQDDGLNTDMYKEGAAWARAIRYLSYGAKGESFYTRVGIIDNGSLGNGFLMYHFNNSANYEQRKLGVQLDMDFDNAGFESIYTNFGRPEIFGIRGFYRPLASSEMPILKSLEVGATFTKDFFTSKVDTSITAIGFDMGLKILDLEKLKWKLYFDFGKITNYGSGSAIGSSFIIPNIAGLFEFGAKYEYRSVGDKFVPSLFNSGYELSRARNSVYSSLDSAKSTSGYFGEIAVNVLSTFTVKGNYSKLDGGGNNGIFYAELIAPDLGGLVEIGARYSKASLVGADELFTFDERSVAEFDIGYQLNSYMFVTMLYRWNWVGKFDDNGIREKDKYGKDAFDTQKTLIPQVKFKYQF